MTNEQYKNFQIDTAKAWVDFYWKGIINTQALLVTSVFWGWWALHWNNADDKDILQTIYSASQDQRHSKYRQLHQYVFDADSLSHRNMAKDFLGMVSYFEKEIKKTTVYE